MFIGRLNEKNLLNEKIISNKFEFGIVYGRRRVGKTSLLKEILRTNKGIYFVASEMTYEYNMISLSKVIAQFYNEPVVFDNLEDIFKYIVYKSKEERVVLIIDEFTYLMSQTQGILSVLQNIIDSLKEENICLILSGSQVGMIESVITYSKPLYGRASFKLKLEPFNYLESSYFYPSYSNKDKVLAYSIFGGVPYYLSLIDENKSIIENMNDLIIKDTGILRNEVEFILKQELRSVMSYAMILDAIAYGATKLNEISDKAKIGNTGNAVTYINNLIDLGIVERQVSIKEKENSRKSIYLISDNLVRFMYTFIYPNKSAIQIMSNETFYNRLIEPKLNVYVSYSFEIISKEFLIRKNKQIENPFYSIGKFWGNNSKLKIEVEFDIVALNEEDTVIYECKWTNDKFSLPIYNKLKLHGSVLKPTKYGGFSYSGFTKEALDKLDYAYTLDDLFKE